jgi:hypothetical protein
MNRWPLGSPSRYRHTESSVFSCPWSVLPRSSPVRNVLLEANASVSNDECTELPSTAIEIRPPRPPVLKCSL